MEDLELIELAKKGDVKARNELVMRHWGLVVHLAVNMVPRNRPDLLADLVQEGFFALCHAIDKYNPKKGVKYSTYAAIWLKQKMRRWIQQEEEEKTWVITTPSRPDELYEIANEKEVLYDLFDQFKEEVDERNWNIYRDKYLTSESVSNRTLGERYNLSAERIRQILDETHKKFLNYLKEHVEET